MLNLSSFSSYLLFFLFSFSSGLYAQHKTAPVPNVHAIAGDYLYAAIAEVTNIQYQEFLYYQRKHHPDQYPDLLPDTTAWEQLFSHAQPLVKTYFRHPAYAEYPVVNLSHDQAQAYCAWLTDILNEGLSSGRLEGHAKKVLVRLPTEAEWELAAHDGRKGADRSWYPWGHNTLRYTGKGKQEGQLLANYYRSGSSHPGSDPHFTMPAYGAYPPTEQFGLYQLAGNVAEMIDVPGISKGGSWYSPASSLRITERESYDAAHPTVGFRYFVEIVEFNDLPTKQEPLDAKAIESKFTSIGAGARLYAAKFETSNAEYRQFITETAAANDIAADQWRNYFPHLAWQQYHLRATYDDYPVVNISHAAARAYCQWLTDTYHAQEKRQFKKVIFRLPSPAEWETAAAAGRSGAVYPWGGPYCRNAKGCLLANFSVLEEQYQRARPAADESGARELYYDYPDQDFSISRGVDGYEVLAPVKSFFPNDYGLYQMAGNAAEMLAEPGLSKGGSWVSHQDEILIGYTATAHAPAPTLGFRVFMEVLE